MVTSSPAFVLHGHFYQPPRENPWTGIVPRQRSAAPAHDWNERVTAEAYRPNGWARVIDDSGRVVSIVNNYEHLSFNVGPTLLSWLEEHEPDVYERILAADAATGRAIAQAYSHPILPLSDDRDLRTQIRWGLADFAHRFGRGAVGMWLPETAVNDRVLRALAEEGVRFTILAPTQAEAVSPLDSDHDWTDVGAAGLDVSQPYRWIDPDDPDLHVDLVFYDGDLSHRLAFTAPSSQEILDHVEAGSGSLVCAATDGETFGHHQKFTERSVAHLAEVESVRRRIEMPRLADHLAEHPPTSRVRVRESAWSCAHGVGRWKEDCGCHTGGEPTWNQAWRTPLRAALDVLRDHNKEVFERRGAELFHGDPWDVRDAYVDVVLDPTRYDGFVASHVRGDPVSALALLEAQRHGMLAYTSCGWFFNDLAGIETVQVLRYAARAIDHLDELGEPLDLEQFLSVLEKGRSNLAHEGSGRDIWERYVVPSRVDTRRIVAHLALVDLLESRPGSEQLAGHAVTLVEHEHLERGGLTGCTGIIELRHLATHRTTQHRYAALHLGWFEVHGAVAAADGTDVGRVARLVDDFNGGARVTALLHEIVTDFGPWEFGLDSALPGAAVQIVASQADAVADRFADTLEHLVEDHRSTLAALRVAGYELPEMISVPIELAMRRRISDRLERVAEGDLAALDEVIEGVAEALGAGIELPEAELAPMVGRALDALVETLVDDGDADQTDLVGAVDTLLDLAVPADLARAQERLFDALEDLGDDADLHALARRLGLALDRYRREP